MAPQVNKQYLGCFGAMHTRIKPVAIVIHHTCTGSPASTRRALDKKGCSTHFEVDKDGTIYQYRECDRMCSHCGSNNFHAIGIDVTHLAGAPFPAAQIAAVRELVGYLCEAWGIEPVVYDDLPSGVYPHRALGNTACPDNFPLEELK